jgi:hypothetical protein
MKVLSKYLPLQYRYRPLQKRYNFIANRTRIPFYYDFSLLYTFGGIFCRSLQRRVFSALAFVPIKISTIFFESRNVRQIQRYSSSSVKEGHCAFNNVMNSLKQVKSLNFSNAASFAENDLFFIALSLI